MKFLERLILLFRRDKSEFEGRTVHVEVHGRTVRGKVDGKNRHGLHHVDYKDPDDGMHKGKWLPENELAFVEES